VSVNTKGFTIVELTIALLVGSMLSLTILAFTFSFYMDSLKAQAETNMLIESQTILRRVADDMRYSSKILVTTTLPDENEPTDGWNTSNDDLILVLSTPAINTSGEFAFNELTGSPYQNELIFYADGTDFHKRVLANPTASSNRTYTTCPEEVSNSTCPPDPLFSENFKDMSFVFHD